jgi:hypothetical protein
MVLRHIVKAQTYGPSCSCAGAFFSLWFCNLMDRADGLRHSVVLPVLGLFFPERATGIGGTRHGDSLPDYLHG